ncbi:MAG: DJ-1/PfpI family protein [Planctomycetes bacterium]|nr:DJ-1/PfpI family protein [Planctomycetota bacterium]MCC8116584.1 DJ-1/PfpI family protein [Planctomycetota bacterium]MCD7897417.1 DJ-1/PfpI family protein [Planctomycetaceae bacterium]
MTRIGFLVFPDMLQLDFTGAYAVLAAGPDVTVHLLWKDVNPIRTSDKLLITPDTAITGCPQLDVVVVPGGGGVVSLMNDGTVLDFLRRQAAEARWVTSVCTGALVLGAAGLLHGYQATTHWLSHDLLPLFGAEPRRRRVVEDRNRLTGAGVSSSIDMALTLAGRLWGDTVAESIQLNMEYDPSPPYHAGSPESAPREVVAAMRDRSRGRQAERRDAAIAAAERLRGG